MKENTVRNWRNAYRLEIKNKVVKVVSLLLHFQKRREVSHYSLDGEELDKPVSEKQF